MIQQQSSVPLTARFLRRVEVQNRTGLSRSSIYRGVQECTFPKPVRLGSRMVGWVESEIQAWIEARIGDRRSREFRSADSSTSCAS